MIESGLALFSALVLAAAEPPAPPALDAGPAPLLITSCRLSVEHHGPRGSVEQVVVVSFANKRDTPADIARFTVANAGGVGRAFTARGSFTKGALIADRILPAQALREASGGNQGSGCVLTYVHFVDGSSWLATP